MALGERLSGKTGRSTTQADSALEGRLKAELSILPPNVWVIPRQAEDQKAQAKANADDWTLMPSQPQRKEGWPTLQPAVGKIWGASSGWNQLAKRTGREEPTGSEGEGPSACHGRLTAPQWGVTVMAAHKSAQLLVGGVNGSSFSISEMPFN